MNWVRRHNFQLYVRNSIWIFPVVGIFGGIIAAALLNRLETAFGLTMNLSPETGRTVMSAIAASMFSLVIVVSSAVLVAVQIASAQLTPRIVALVYRSSARKAALTAFVFMFTFSVAVLLRIETTVPLLTSYFAAYGFLLNLALFLYFIDGVGKLLRPSTALRAVALVGREVIHSVYPHKLDEKDSAPAELVKEPGGQPRVILSSVDGVVLAFDLKGLLSIAEQSQCVIELVPQVGDFVADGDPLFRIYEGGENIPEETLTNSVAVGQERTIEQDPMFAFRVIVDIASKALSPAINDPTTAVLAIDQIHHLLRDVGFRYLADGREAGASGRLRLIYRTPNWDDFVYLAVTELRQYGRDSIQVNRRLRAMLETLIEILPERRAPLLLKELGLLEAAAKRTFPDLEDQLLAVASDLQGMGGSQSKTNKRNAATTDVAKSAASKAISAA